MTRDDDRNPKGQGEIKIGIVIVIVAAASVETGVANDVATPPVAVAAAAAAVLHRALAVLAAKASLRFHPPPPLKKSSMIGFSKNSQPGAKPCRSEKNAVPHVGQHVSRLSSGTPPLKTPSTTLTWLRHSRGIRRIKRIEAKRVLSVQPAMERVAKRRKRIRLKSSTKSKRYGRGAGTMRSKRRRWNAYAPRRVV